MTCLGPFELNIIKRKIIEKLYMFSPRTLSYDRLRVAVDNPQSEDFDAAKTDLIKENIVKVLDEQFTLSDEGIAIYENQGKYKEYFPLSDNPRTNFG